MVPNGPDAIAAFNSYNQCKQAGGTDKGVSYDSSSTTSNTGGLMVNGEALPLTPVA